MEREPARLTLRTIGTFEVHAEREKIYLFENPAVFSVFVKNTRTVQQSAEMDSQDLQHFFCWIF